MIIFRFIFKSNTVILLTIYYIIVFFNDFQVDPTSLGIPDNEYDIVMLVRKAFIHNFLKVAIIKPLLTIKNPELLFDW